MSSSALMARRVVQLLVGLFFYGIALSLMVRGAMEAEVERVLAAPEPVEGKPMSEWGQPEPEPVIEGANGRMEMSRERGNGAAHRETMN